MQGIFRAIASMSDERPHDADKWGMTLASFALGASAQDRHPPSVAATSTVAKWMSTVSSMRRA